CRAFGISGFFNVQFVLDADTGEAHLLEINRRTVTHMHMGERVGADLAVALYDHLRGSPPASAAGFPGDFGPKVAVFPREWLRDPDSRYLRECPVDVPWDEPELIEAMLAMRYLPADRWGDADAATRPKPSGSGTRAGSWARA